MIIEMPQKKPVAERRNYQAMVRMTVTERNRMRACASRSGKPLATFLREAGVEKSGSCSPPEASVHNSARDPDGD